MTFEQRCRVSEKCLPEAPYREMLTELHNQMLEALAQPAPVQEPVAWMDVDEKGAMSGLRYWSEPDNRHEVALYTTPPQRTWVGLTHKDVQEIHDTFFKRMGPQEFASMIGAKLKEKNNG